MKYKDFVTSILQETSGIARKSFGKVSWSLKDDYNQVLTETDEEIGEYIIQKIQKNFPKHNIIDEEAGAINNNSDFTWVIDPIDGTSNFAFGVPSYGTMIGLLHKDIPIIGGLALPEFKEIYFAEKGKGATCNGKRVKVTAETDLSRSLISYSIDANRENSHLTEKECQLAAKIILNVRSLRMSNSVFDTAMVITGKYGAYLMQHSKIWDNVAQEVLVKEAGGKYTDFFGKPINYKDAFSRLEENFTFCLAAAGLHTKLQKIIHSSVKEKSQAWLPKGKEKLQSHF